MGDHGLAQLSFDSTEKKKVALGASLELLEAAGESSAD